MNQRYLSLLVLAAVAAIGIAANARAASFAGTVTLPDGRPAFGAMLSVFNAEHTRKQTAYTAADGSYAIVTPYEGRLDLRARLANFDDATVTVDAVADS